MTDLNAEQQFNLVEILAKFTMLPISLIRKINYAKINGN